MRRPAWPGRSTTGRRHGSRADGPAGVPEGHDRGCRGGVPAGQAAKPPTRPRRRPSAPLPKNRPAGRPTTPPGQLRPLPLQDPPRPTPPLQTRHPRTPPPRTRHRRTPPRHPQVPVEPVRPPVVVPSVPGGAVNDPAGAKSYASGRLAALRLGPGPVPLPGPAVDQGVELADHRHQPLVPEPTGLPRRCRQESTPAPAATG